MRRGAGAATVCVSVSVSVFIFARLLSLQLSIFQLLYVIRSPHDLVNGKPLDARKSLQIAVNCELSTSNLDFDFNLNSYF